MQILNNIVLKLKNTKDNSQTSDNAKLEALDLCQTRISALKI